MGTAANAALAAKSAAAGTRAAGKAVTTATSRARTPLIVGGAAAAGLAGGLALLRRAQGGPGLLERARSSGSRNGSLDLDTIASAARRLGALGNQVGDIASAMQQAGKAAKPD